MKTGTSPSTFAQFSREAEPATVHVKMAAVSYPLTQQVKPVRKNQMLVAPLGSLKEVGMEHQAFRFNVSKNNRGCPAQPLRKSFWRHVIQLPGRLGNDVIGDCS